MGSSADFGSSATSSVSSIPFISLFAWGMVPSSARAMSGTDGIRVIGINVPQTGPAVFTFSAAGCPSLNVTAGLAPPPFMGLTLVAPIWPCAATLEAQVTFTSANWSPFSLGFYYFPGNISVLSLSPRLVPYDSYATITVTGNKKKHKIKYNEFI